MATKIGILALQGCVEPHRNHLDALGVEVVEVRRGEDFDGLNGLILPGGESTTMLKLIDHFQIWNVLKTKADEIPYWGVCAGSILMAKRVLHPAQRSLGIVHVAVERNAYGRQRDSHQVEIQKYPVAFIRAPMLTELGKKCEVVATHRGSPVWITEGPHMITTFHAELTPIFPSPFHRAFVARCTE